MADTHRTLAQLQALLADNTTGNISPQDLRDLMESLRDRHGSIHIGTPAATPVAVAGTFYKLAGTTALETGALDFDMPADNRLRYTGAVQVRVHVNFMATMQAVAGTNQVVALRAALNGTTDAFSECRATLKAATDQQTLSLHWDGLMSNGDFVELWGTNITATNNIQMDTVHIFARSLFGA